MRFCLIFRSCFFDGCFNRLLMGFASQNPPQIDPKSTKNRSPNPLLCWLRSCIVFSSILTLTPDASNPKITEKVLCFIAFKRLKPFRAQVRFGFDFGPIWLHFGINFGAKSTKTAIKKDIPNVIDFLIVFLTILAPFWNPCLVQLGHLSL